MLHILSIGVLCIFTFIIILQESNFTVENVQYQGKFIFHIGTASGSFKVGDEVILCVDAVRCFQYKKLNNHYYRAVVASL